MSRKTYTITGNGKTTTAHAWNSALRKSATLLPVGSWLRSTVAVGDDSFTHGVVTWKNRVTGEYIAFIVKQVEE